MPVANKTMTETQAANCATSILLVDDDPDLLRVYELALRRKFTVQTANSADAGLDVLRQERIGVVVADMGMPRVSGIEFLAQVHKISPDTVRMMLTGATDLDVAINAVNTGQVFRFLRKPCSAKALAETIEAGVDHHQLITARKELLNNTLTGSMGLLADMLSISAPALFAQLGAIRSRTREVARKIGLQSSWDLECASAICFIGCAGLPALLIERIAQGESVTMRDRELFLTHPEIGARLLSHIPRMNSVVEIIRYQEKHFDGSGTPDDDVAGEAIPIGARVLKATLDYNRLISGGNTAPAAYETMKARSGVYCPRVLCAFAPSESSADSAASHRSLLLMDARPGMQLAETVYSQLGGPLLVAGTELTAPIIDRLQAFAGTVTGVREPIFVFPDAPAPAESNANVANLTAT